MRPFRYVSYVKIGLKLDGMLRMGDGDEDGVGMATNARGEFIIPATGIAGSVRHALAGGDWDGSKKAVAADGDDIEGSRDQAAGGDDHNEKSALADGAGNDGSRDQASDSDAFKEINWKKYFGDKDTGDSRIYFYDAVCNEAYIEKRTGVQLDSHYGVAKEKLLYNTYYLSDGLTTELRIQTFSNDEKDAQGRSERKKMDRIVHEIVRGIASGKITFGAKTGIGAGRFALTDTRSLVLDLRKAADREKYLDGVEACFMSCEPDEKLWAEGNDIRPDFLLLADIPDGLLVKSGDMSDIADAVNMKHAKRGRNAANSGQNPVSNGENDEAAEAYYIPGSSLKGLFRSYAENISVACGLGEEHAKLLVTELFGSDNSQDKEKRETRAQEAEKKTAPRKAGRIYFRDVEITEPKAVLHSRIKIDRWLGGAMETAKMSEQLLSTEDNDEAALRIEVRLGEIKDSRLLNAAKALVFLTCRDLARGALPVGSGSSQGLGRLHGRRLTADGMEFKVEDGRILPDDGVDESGKGFLGSDGNVADSVYLHGQSTNDASISDGEGITCGKCTDDGEGAADGDEARANERGNDSLRVLQSWLDAFKELADDEDEDVRLWWGKLAESLRKGADDEA